MSKIFKDIYGEHSNETYDGDFVCRGEGLTSLEGCYKKVNGEFNCAYNNLTSLKGAPEYVEDNFDCSGNELVLLKGTPKYVGGDFSCYNNTKLKNLNELIYSEAEIQGKIICDKTLQKEADAYKDNLKLFKKLGSNKKKYKAIKNLEDTLGV
jgi:hypothetical protein